MSPDFLTAAGTVLSTVALVGALMGFGLRRMDKRFEQVDKRFEQVDKRFEQVDKQFELIGQQIEGVKRDIRGLEHELTEVKITVARWEGPPRRLVSAR